MSADHLGMPGIPNRHTIVANPLNSKDRNGTCKMNFEANMEADI